MKRYLIPVLVIVIVGVATYWWTSKSSSRRAMAKARHAHLDSLRALQVHRFLAAAATTARDVTPHDSLPDPVDEEIKDSFGDIWASRHLDAMPDSIRPQDFTESMVKYDFSYTTEGDGYIDEEDPSMLILDTSYKRVDTVATKIAQSQDAFIRYTVVAMLSRHLQGAFDADEFSRCPSGYFYTLNNFVMSPPPPEPVWDSGTVYLGSGCSDTTVCDFRFNYSKRLVEMKDCKSDRFMSLREYEVEKFRQYADVPRSKN